MAKLNLPGGSDKGKGPDTTSPAPKKGGFSLAGLFGKKKPAKPVEKASQTTTHTNLSAVGPVSASPVGSKTIMTPALGSKPGAGKPGAKKDRVFKLPVIGDKPVEAQLQVLGIIALASLFFAAAAVGLDTYQRGNNSTFINITSLLQYHTQRLAKSAGLAARGDANSFAQLQDSRDEFGNYVNVLNNGGPIFSTSVPPAGTSEELRSRLVELTKRNEEVSSYASAILAARNDLTALSRNIAQVRAGSEELAALSQEITGLMQQSGAAPGQVLRANRLTFFAERLGRGAAEILGSDTIDPEVPFLMGKDTNDFRELLKALDVGSEAIGVTAVRDSDAKARIAALKEQFTNFEQNVSPILANVQKLVSARQSARALTAGSEQLANNVELLQGALQAERSNLMVYIAVALAILGVVVLGLMALVFGADARRRAAESEAENKRNQEAILRLLNEMGDLADGDLTIRAKVTEDITGAIADSMNYTIDELRSLVTGVNNASTQVSVKSQQAQAVAVQLLDAAEKQSREIQETTQQVLGVAETLTQVSRGAEESAQVAMRSLAASDKGRLAVQNSISGMNDIREQIQETSKRIKRLGESSQEIGEIVELITDITEQTNVLALNAAIQAASAGDAGRGFSVVAEEVQRLAERSAEATKQIGAIVKTIQADTQDAVAAMEKSTQGVVEGAKLSDAAGQALTEIDSVTKNLATLIQKISSDTQTQAASANKVAKNMQDILEITRQTTVGTQQTASSIQELASVANDLKASVSGFKL
ncbi:MAG: type IV pili methyl-accepting chemotaxis transducer N-terminal domain-containing protein [Betaproteobacteria bacterium]|nr:type IV pili methyl-accepting chemotaxis transducer N-terminal domain-containing protein [Betaproteobacteria bacterium]